MGKDKDEDKPIELTPEETFQTDFLSKISLVVTVITTVMSLIFINLLSNGNLAEAANVTASYSQILSMIFIFIAIVGAAFLIVPVVFNMFIYIFEDMPDKKIPIKRGINRLILGLLLLSLLFALCTIPAITEQASFFKILMVLTGFMIDLIFTLIKLKYKPEMSIKWLMPVFLFSGLIVSPINVSAFSLIWIILSKISILFTINFISQFQETEQGKKKNVIVLAVTFLISMHLLILYFMFRETVNQYVLDNGEALVNQIVKFLAKAMSDNPFKVAKLFG